MLALDLGGRARLTNEPREGLRASYGVRKEKLEGDPLVQLDVVRGHDDAHATGAEDPLDAILSGEDVAEFRAGLLRARHHEPGRL